MPTAEATSVIRKVVMEDLPRMRSAASAFYASSKHLRDFDFERFHHMWDLFLQGSGAEIFVYEKDGEIVGALGGLLHRNLYGSEMIAEEFFWFIKPEHRGAGVRLYHAFEDWARSKGAQWIQMVHLKDLMPEKVAHFYERMGYEAIETRYEKSLT